MNSSSKRVIKLSHRYKLEVCLLLDNEKLPREINGNNFNLFFCWCSGQFNFPYLVMVKHLCSLPVTFMLENPNNMAPYCRWKCDQRRTFLKLSWLFHPNWKLFFLLDKAPYCFLILWWCWFDLRKWCVSFLKWSLVVFYFREASLPRYALSGQHPLCDGDVNIEA